MIVFLCRGLVRLVALVALPLLALVALAFAVAAVAGGEGARSLADGTGLTAAWGDVGAFLRTTAPAGDGTAVLAAVGAVVLGVVLLVGALAPTRERELHLDGSDGSLGIRRRALRAALGTLVRHLRGATGSRVALRPRRRGVGGRVRVTVTRTPRADAEAIRAATTERVDALTGPFALRIRVRTTVGRSRRSRVE